ncbi:DAHP synthetase [Auriculariales sp. MPI-PUGE-AT-0066]|nr:DAHP synthetase [Auriculariales sp. MPI-PUGE-AT-0066]
MSSRPWSPITWRSKPLAQAIKYDDPAKLETALGKIKHLPGLVTPSEIERLRHQLALVQQNKAFLLHAGDCAESFDACTYENIQAKLGLILSFSLILVWGARMPVVRIGRIAGQYAKPRSSGTERIGNRDVPSFRGDNVNGFDPDDRKPDPDRLLHAYFHSVSTLNCMRSLLSSGFASLNDPRGWSLSHVRSPVLRKEFERISESISDAMDFSKTIGVESASSYERGGVHNVLATADVYISHEGLLLDYEESLTRQLPVPNALRSSSTPREAYYNTSAHFIWIGDRTRQLDGAHVEYFRGIRNPIGIKVGPSMQPDELVRLLNIVNPDREAGRVTLITRYGAEKIFAFLAGHISVVQQSEHPVTWVCDPMHGNTLTTTAGVKTRHFRTIVSELAACLRIHTECSSRLGGVSLEFTGEINDEGFSVTECLGGSMELSEEQLGLRYQSFCDPRLNFEQSLDVAFIISDFFKQQRVGALNESSALMSEINKKIA